MKLLVLAQTPPPLHGQSLAVQTLIDYLRSRPEWEVHHVNLRMSRDIAEIGSWRFAKVVSALGACIRVWGLFLRRGRMPIYYVPAPAKRGALYRDWLVLALCRPFARALVLHWHGVGLGEWLEQRATRFERAVSRVLLGRAALSIAQADIGRTDCERLRPRRCEVVRNGVSDPLTNFVPRNGFRTPSEVLFVGLGCHEKGLFDAMEGVALANAAAAAQFRFTAVGQFASPAVEREFFRRARELEPAVRHLGFVSNEEKSSLLRSTDIFCFPSYYPHEGQPAVLLEALAHDLPIVTTRWRGIPEGLPSPHVYFVEPRSPGQIASQLLAARAAGPPQGSLRRHFQLHFTKERHLALLEGLLRQVVSTRT